MQSPLVQEATCGHKPFRPLNSLHRSRSATATFRLPLREVRYKPQRTSFVCCGLGDGNNPELITQSANVETAITRRSLATAAVCLGLLAPFHALAGECNAIAR